MNELNENYDKKVDDESIEVPTEIVFRDETGVEFTLGFDRESAMKAEKVYDLSLNEIMSGKTSVIMDLFSAAFIKNHPHAKPQTVQRLWEALEDKQGLCKALVTMYGNTAGSLLEEPEKGKGMSWKAR